MAIFRGMLVDYSGAKTVTTDSLPAWLLDLPRLNLFAWAGIDIRAMVVIALVVVAGVGVAAATPRGQSAGPSSLVGVAGSGGAEGATAASDSAISYRAVRRRRGSRKT